VLGCDVVETSAELGFRLTIPGACDCWCDVQLLGMNGFSFYWDFQSGIHIFFFLKNVGQLSSGLYNK
jgi:hypothetical protein